MTILLMLFFFLHIFQVVRAGWSNFASMVTGYRLDRADSAEVAPASAFGRHDLDGFDENRHSEVIGPLVDDGSAP